LFTAISDTYGSTDSTNFLLPGLRGRVIAGKDDMGLTSANRLTNQTGGLDGDGLGNTGGSETNTLTLTNLPSGITYIDNTATIDTVDNYAAFNYQPYTYNLTPAKRLSGSDTPHNVVQPTIILNYIIKT